MSESGNKLKMLVITGNPTIDAVIRYGLLAAFTFLTGTITGWLNAHGFNDPNLTYYVGAAVAAVLSSLALAIWGVMRTSKNEAIVKLREAIAVQAGINVATNPAAPTPVLVDVKSAQKVIAEHGPDPSIVERK